MSNNNSSWVVGFYKNEKGDVSEVYMHEIDFASACSRFPGQYSKSKDFSPPAPVVEKKPAVKN